MSRAFERWCYRPRTTRHLVAVSEGLRREIAEHMPRMAEHTTVIRNGVDVDVFRPDAQARAEFRAEHNLAHDALLAVFVGGEWEGKGLRFAIEALAQAPGWQLMVVGRGDVARYAAMAERAGVAGRVHFLGTLRDPQRCYAAADAFVFPSVYETFSLVAHEAAACGLPLLCTRVSGIEELVEDGRNGWFVGRDAGEIARRLTTLDDPALRAHLGANARSAAERVTWQAMLDGYERLYHELSGRAEPLSAAAAAETVSVEAARG